MESEEEEGKSLFMYVAIADSVYRGYCAILISRPQHLEIQVLRQHQSARCTRSYSDICYSVQQTVTRTLEDVISRMKYKPYAKIKTPIIAGKRPFEFAFTCCLEDSHANHSMKVVEDDDGLFAECCKTRSEIELMKEYLVWFNKVRTVAVTLFLPLT